MNNDFDGRASHVTKQSSDVTESARTECSCDPAICRRQFPDGHVPGNAKEAAEGWFRWYDSTSKFNDARRDRIDELTNALEIARLHVEGAMHDGSGARRADEDLRTIDAVLAKAKGVSA